MGSSLSSVERSPIDVINHHVMVSPSGCWEWTGATSRGYGQITYQGKHQTAHRFAFENLVEPIEDGNWVLHHCDNKLCVNPDHLYQGTPVDNRADMINRGRWNHPWASRTHCANGHEYVEGSFRIAKDGSRACRTCDRDHKRAYRASKKGVIQ